MKVALRSREDNPLCPDCGEPMGLHHSRGKEIHECGKCPGLKYLPLFAGELFALFGEVFML